ncbi:hypothetical protein L207DRAFT_390959, partial [Hyaloscypha variabilis F]
MTERTAIRQSMVDDDAISLTSTAVSEYDSEAEFSVDRILAEKTQSGKKRYLIFWEGYPLEKATWEPDKNINDEILDAWKERKAQESKGLEPPFNVAEFDALLARLAAEKADRRRRRKAKRKRIGRAVSPSASEADDSDSSIEAIEQNEVEDMKPGSKRKSKSPPKRPAKALKPANGRRGSTSSLASIDAARKLPVRKASGMSKKPSERSQPPSRQASEVSAPNVWRLTAARKTASSSEPSEPQSTRGAHSSRGRVATRGGGNVAHKNVFQAREPPKKRGTLLKNAMDPEKPPKKFSNMRLHRKAELQARDLAEGAPDISALGGLFDPSRPDSMIPIRPENLRKTSSNMVSFDTESNPLSVSETRTSSNNSRDAVRRPLAEVMDVDPSTTPTKPIRPPWNPSQPYNAICYSLRTTGDCADGHNCKYRHGDDPSLPLAPSPREQRAYHSMAICFFYAASGACPDDRDCQYIHSNDRNLAVAPSPLEVGGRPAWNSRDPLHAICYFLASTGSCKLGTRCKFIHSGDPSLPIAPSPNVNEMRGLIEYDERGRPTCKYWLRDDCRDTAQTCRWWHGPPSAKRQHALATNGPSVRFAMNEDELPTTTKVSQPMPHPGIIKPLEVSAVVPNPSSGSADLATKINPKMKIDDFRRKKALKELGNRAKEVTFGLDESQSLMLDVGDLSQALRLPWGLSFSGITKILFDQMCIAQDFQVQQGLLQRSRLWHGNMLPADSGDSETIKAIDKAADELICRSAGLLSSIQDFLVLVFPAKRDEWKFLEGMLDYSQDARLRYFIFQSNIDIRQSFRIKPTSLDIGASYREVLVEKIHGLDIKRILPIIKRSKPKSPNVYLLFPSTAAQTAEFIISWLRSSNRNCKIYTSQSEGSWQFFTHNPEIDQATVLVHESAAAELHRLPNLYSMVVEKNYSFWYISESSSPYPLFPSNTYHFDDATMGQLNAVRLFPHGCAFLLTPSFLVAEPHNAIQILSWFILSGSKSKYLSSTPRTWKLVCCHDLLDYTLEIANSKAAEKDALELKHRDNPAKDAILHEAGLSFPECNNRYKLHRMLVEFDSKRSLDSYSECDSDEGESEYPFIHANKHIDPDNEKALVEWFAAWTMRNLDMYKKFVVVGSSEA